MKIKQNITDNDVLLAYIMDDHLNQRLQNALKKHQTDLTACQICPEMHRPVIAGDPVPSPILLVGQAPGIHEGEIGKPFGWTAGKTLFKWLENIGPSEQECRQSIYFSAVCRCFPGKSKSGGDRVPSTTEIKHCAVWLNNEIKLLQPKLIIPVGKLAIYQFVNIKKLDEIIGTPLNIKINTITTTLIALPHPSGASTWHRREPGIQLLSQALQHIKQHPAWTQTFSTII